MEANPRRVGAGSHREIVLQFATIAVIGQIDPAIEPPHLQAAIVRYALAPFGRIVAQVEIRSGVFELSSGDVSALAGAIEVQPDVPALRPQQGFLGRKFKMETGASRDESSRAALWRGFKT